MQTNTNPPASPPPPPAVPRHAPHDLLVRMLGQIAFWQTMGFFALAALVWAIRIHGVFDYFWPGMKSSDREWYGAWSLTAGIFAIGIIVVVNTHQQQKRILKGLITVCSFCRKVHVEASDWQQMEDFITSHTMTEFTHGICPECHGTLMKEMDAVVPPKSTGSPP